jgi:metal-responsive CopG/Arc/MetJ family transcriptional regulator
VAKVLVSFPDDLLERLDREAGERGITRSALLQQATQRELGWADPVQLDAALARGRAALARADSFESADLIRADRDLRDVHDRRR